MSNIINQKYIYVYEKPNEKIIEEVLKEGDFQIFLKTLVGSSIVLNINSENTIEQIKHKIWEKERLPIHALRIIFQGKELEDKRTADFYDIKKRINLAFTF